MILRRIGLALCLTILTLQSVNFFAVFEFAFMVLHERPIHCVDCSYESRGVSLLDGKSYDFIWVTAWELSACIVFQFTPVCKSPLYVNRPYMEIVPICKVNLPTLVNYSHFAACINLSLPFDYS